jgi:hypothetical protein
MKRHSRPLALVLALGLGPACKTDPDRPDTHAPGSGPATSGVGNVGTTPGNPGPKGARRPGVAHSGAIDKIAVSADGTGAVTSDLAGGARLWAALDGSQEPIALPVRAPQSMSLARDGESWTIFLVDASGGAKIVSVDASGRARTLAELAPFAPLFEGHVLPGGKHVVALFRDHTIRVLDAAGKELARLEERKFRPGSLRVSADGKRVLAVIATPEGSGTSKLELQPLTVTLDGKAAIKRAGSPKLFTPTVAPAPSTVALSPDGTRVAIVDRWNGTQWDIVVVELDGDVAEKRLTMTAAAHTVPGVGFVSPTRVMASANDGSVSWLIDVESKALYPRSAPPQDFNTQFRVQAFGTDRHVAAHGSWLYVSEVATRQHRFLGYRSLQATSLAISPNSTSIAAVYPQGPVWVEPLSGSPHAAAELPTDPFNGVFRVRFADDDHLLLVDGMGGVRMTHWRTGKTVAEAGVNGSVRSVQVDNTRGLLLIDRHSTVNDSRLFELRDHQFRGPYIVADLSYRTGLLSAGAPGQPDAVMWSLDSANRLRFYTLAELRSDLSDDEVKRKAIDLKPGQVAPLALDREGRQYGVRWNGNRMELFVDNGEHVRSRAVGDGSVNEILPASDGKSFLAVHQRSGGMAVSVYDSEDLKERWAMSTGTFHNEVVWSGDGRYVGVAAQTGAAVRSALSGDTAYQRCGLDFQVTGTAPNTALSNVNQRTICEP